MALNTTSNETNSIDRDSDIAYWEQIVIAVAIVLIAVAGLIGNSMIILAVAFSRKLQTATNAFVINLAIADLLTSFVLICSAVGVLGEDEWPIPQAYWMCEAIGFSIRTFISTSVYNLAVIAVNRLICITKPNLYKKLFSSCKIAVLLAITWIVPIGMYTIVDFENGNKGFGYNKQNKECTSLIEELLIVEMVTLLPLCTVIVLSYFRIYIYVKRHFNAQKNNISNISTYSKDDIEREQGSISKTAVTEGSTATIRMAAVPAISRKDQLSKQQIDITKNLFAVVSSFFICFVPSAILNSFQTNATIAHIIFYTKLATFTNSSINFVIYAKNHPDFKIVLGHMMKRSYIDIPQPSKFLKFLILKKK